MIARILFVALLVAVLTTSIVWTGVADLAVRDLTYVFLGSFLVGASVTMIFVIYDRRRRR